MIYLCRYIFVTTRHDCDIVIESPGEIISWQWAWDEGKETATKCKNNKRI